MKIVNYYNATIAVLCNV